MNIDHLQSPYLTKNSWDGKNQGVCAYKETGGSWF
jgi:hypothetical protein